MAGANAAIGYIPGDSPTHRLSGATKLIAFILWSVAAMCSFDTRVLAGMLLLIGAACAVTRIRWRDVRFVVRLALIFLALNTLALYALSPEYGATLYKSRHVLINLPGRYALTGEELFYLLNVCLKVAVVIPAALIFFIATDPSEFAASLNRIGVSYRVAYSVALALRYIPDLQREYRGISQAQQARGVDLAGKDHLLTRLKNSVSILLPLMLSSLARIEVISNVMELRGFGKNKTRSWYSARPFAASDRIVLAASALVLLLSLLVSFWNGGRFFNPFC